MEPHYSKVLIYEFVMPNAGAHWQTTATDMTMMGIAGRERTEKQWHQLLGSVGLKITQIWHIESGAQSLIEAVLADD
jgi:hypothetical protein